MRHHVTWTSVKLSKMSLKLFSALTVGHCDSQNRRKHIFYIHLQVTDLTQRPT